MNAPLLSIVDLTKRFGALLVSDSVSLALAPGRLHALIGPNGAGKTSLINQISGALASDSGQVHFAGVDVTHLDLPARARRGLLRSFQIASIPAGVYSAGQCRARRSSALGLELSLFQAGRSRDFVERQCGGGARARGPRRASGQDRGDALPRRKAPARDCHGDRLGSKTAVARRTFRRAWPG